MPAKKARGGKTGKVKPKPSAKPKAVRRAPPPKKITVAKKPAKPPKPEPVPKFLLQRVQDVRQAIARPPRGLSTFPSAEAARLRGQEGLVQLPFLTINDLLSLRRAGFRDIEDLERRWMDVPQEAWPSLVRLVEARVIRLPTELPASLAAKMG